MSHRIMSAAVAISNFIFASRVKTRIGSYKNDWNWLNKNCSKL